MNRGDVVTVAVAGDYGKPRPALIVQNDAFIETPSVTVLLITSELLDAPLLRINVDNLTDTGLTRQSHVMIDKAMTLPRAKIGRRIGKVDNDLMARISKALEIFLDLA